MNIPCPCLTHLNGEMINYEQSLAISKTTHLSEG